MRRTTMWRTAVRLTGICAALGLLSVGCANDLTDFLIEQPLGALSELAINMQYPMDRDPLVRGWVQQLGAEERANVKRKNVPYRFSLVDVSAPNAFAIPYGGVYVTKGLLRFATSEDELAFVLAHEIGHVERRHSSFAFQRGLLINIGLALATNRKNEDYMQLAYLASYFLDLKFSRDAEYGADQSGATGAVWSGYNPHRAVDFFRRLDERYGATPRFWGYFQTHPINVDRISALRRNAMLSLTDPVTLTTIADGYRRREQFGAAERYYQQAVLADPQYADAYLGLARVAAWRGNAQIARGKYNEALRHGADQSSVQTDLAALRDEPDEPRPGIVLASSREVRDARESLQAEAEPVKLALAAAATLAADPVDGASALVSGQKNSGTQIDALTALGDHMAKAGQELVQAGTKLRGAAMAAAAEVGESGREAEETVQLLESNRQRLLAILADRPTRPALDLARRVLDGNNELIGQMRDAADQLRSDSKLMADAVHGSHLAVAALHRELRDGSVSAAATNLLDTELKASNEALNKASARASRSINRIRAGRARGLVSSIDITMLDRRRPQRALAQRQVARFMLTSPEQMQTMFDAGLSYGEAAYALGFAKSSGTEPGKLLTDLGEDRHAVVDRLDRARVRSGNVAILLRLLDLTLRGELEANTAPTSPSGGGTVSG
ncbi:MAG: M48 family metalloprotease [Armatimonadetes bacterium]|nr:M48 family metalloprotease [Armatimonadota bacterium]